MTVHQVLAGAIVGVLVAAGPASAQFTPPGPEKISTGPGSTGWPGTTSANNPVLGGSVPAPFVVPPGAAPPAAAQPLLESAPTAFTNTGNCPPVADHFLTAGGLEPLPDSLEDQFNKELAGRRLFRYCTWRNTRVTGFPNTLLWTPPLAELRAPRMAVTGTTFNNYTNDYTLDTSIGGTLGLVRGEPAGMDAAVQLDMFAVVHTRLSPEDLIASDYRFGFPVTFRRGDWQARVAYEHTSTHLGDEFIENTGRRTVNFARDEVVFGVGRFFFDDYLRIYGTVSYAFFQDLEPKPEPWRFDVGFQYVCPHPTGFAGAPFFAAHVEAPAYTDYNLNLTAQVGYVFANPLQRLANLRVYGQYYEGHSQFGQFYRDREKYFSVGLAGDF